ncbi:hypothetical protein TMatcc_003982 [Talaromyces marneffei ATCC 18224]
MARRIKLNWRNISDYKNSSKEHLIHHGLLLVVNPTKTTNTAAYAAVPDMTSIGFSSTEAINNPNKATHTVVATSEI